ncbi:AFG2-interacting ribosome maturation factor isoform X2 [Anolis sagrei]|uniref:AFG2-interacting ribosome maturation factor isoform X2 n=1 Tax=Anolis sagrei TaxID=38937 RepID=UPI00351F8400
MPVTSLQGKPRPSEEAGGRWDSISRQAPGRLEEGKKAEGRMPCEALRSALRKAFRGVREQHRAWEGALAAVAPLLASLGSLAEQAQALQVADLDQSPLHSFPGLQGRLQAKHRAAAEALLGQLHQKMLPELQKTRDAMGVQVAGILLLCEGPKAELGLESSFQRWPLYPSLADMVEWLLDIERLYHQIYLEAKLLLLQVRYENLTGMQALPKAWEQVVQHSQQQQGTVEDALLKVSFFLKEAA